jgi:hypothetical protein
MESIPYEHNSCASELCLCCWREEKQSLFQRLLATGINESFIQVCLILTSVSHLSPTVLKTHVEL